MIGYRIRTVLGVLSVIVVLMVAKSAVAQPLGDGPWEYAAGRVTYRVAVVTKGLESPWGMAFLPNGDMLVTERPGRLRLVRNGVLRPEPVKGSPADVYVKLHSGLMDIALHPSFTQNQLVYLTYTKKTPDVKSASEKLASHLPADLEPRGVAVTAGGGLGHAQTNAIWMARWNGEALVDGRDIFISNNIIDDSIAQSSASRIAFGPDGKLYMTVGGPNGPAMKGMYAHARGGVAQDPGSDGGKILRLNDDGSVPSDNPFVGRADYRPEIYTVGNRNALGLAVRPNTGELWEHENGPADGDEVNVLKPGANYGWPLVGYGRDYGGGIIGGADAVGAAVGRKDAATMYMDGMEPPVLLWAPTVAPSGMDFYEGDRIPAWKGSLFIGTLKGRRVERYSIMDDGRIFRREWLLGELGQRIRDVRSHDGYIYVLTDMVAGALLRIEPVELHK